MIRTAGNLLTHYDYSACCVRRDGRSTTIHTADGIGDLKLSLTGTTDSLPIGSPFHSLKEARRFAGPLPFTFDYERETHSIIRIEGRRPKWAPQAIGVHVLRNAFLEQAPFRNEPAVLANAFVVENVSYRWMRGVVHAL